MSLLYIIDGYNLIKGSDLFADKDIAQSRVALDRHIASRRPQGSLRNKVVVVYDGCKDVVGSPGLTHFRTVFSQGETADEVIVKMVFALSVPRSTVVVTDDLELRRRVSACGVRCLGVCDFLKKGTGVSFHKKNDRQGKGSRDHLNCVEREKITQELKKIWLTS